jgi:hypothetical protein
VALQFNNKMLVVSQKYAVVLVVMLLLATKYKHKQLHFKTLKSFMLCVVIVRNFMKNSDSMFGYKAVALRPTNRSFDARLLLHLKYAIVTPKAFS